ncbi:MAG: OmpA family protein [Ferruginibacter sp.]|nr:OmpA family protein [Ferruginibacter sp.]
MKKTLLSLIVVFSFLFVNAQVVYDYLKAADNYYKNGDYYSAAEYYEKYLAKGKPGSARAGFSPYSAQGGKSKNAKAVLSSREQAIYNLAESYRQLHLHAKAELIYVQAVKFDKAQFPLAGYWYATTLRALEKYTEAKAAFTVYLNEYPKTDKYANDAKRELANLDFIQSQLNKKGLDMYTVAKTGGEVPDSGAVYAPVLFNDMLYFTSTRANNAVPRLQVHNNRVYQASYKDGMVNNVSQTALPEIKDIHQGVISLSPDGNTLFLTRWTTAKGKKNASIYTSKKSVAGWADPLPLPAVVNVPGYNSQQAYLMPGGKQLVFSSDQPGSYGGYDLWSTDLDANGNPSQPVNLGNLINTVNDEQAPFYHALSGKLVFSSNGRVGMGGYDFYYSKGKSGSWSEPKNFGYPVNSVKDDIYFTSRGKANNILEDVLFSSDRNAVCCLELFSLKMKQPLKLISGQVVICETKTPLGGATVKIVDAVNNTTIISKLTDADGRYSFTLDEFQPLQALASAAGYNSASLNFNSPDDEGAISLANPELCLVPIEIEKPVVVNNVYYDFSKSALKDESFAELDKLVTMFEANPGIVVEISAHTDSKGSDEFNQKLSLARAQSVVDYLVSKGIDKSKLKPTGYAATQPIAPNKNDDGTDNPEGRQLNRRTEFKVLKN